MVGQLNNIKPLVVVGKKDSIMNKLNEAPSKEGQDKLIKTFIDGALKKAGIEVLKYKPMDKSKIGNNRWGGFYTVKSATGNDVLPFYVHSNLAIDLGVSSKDFIIGKYSEMSKVVNNLKKFKKSDLEEGIGDMMSKKISKHKGTRNSADAKKVEKLLLKYGNTKKDVADMMKKYDYVSKTYRNAKPAKKAEILSSLRESIVEGIFGKFDTGAGFKGNGMTVYDRNQEKAGDYKDIAHIAPNGKITIYDKKVKKEPKLMQSLNKISQEFKKTFKESVNESISAFDVDFYKDTNNRQTSHKEIVKGDKFSDVISKTTKVAKSKKMNYVELYYKGAFIGSIDKRNNFKFRKGRNHQKSPLSVNEACWVGYKQVGMKDKNGKKVPNCVKEIYEIFYEEGGKGHGYTFEHIKDLSLTEAEYQGRKVKLGKIMQGDQKKFKVYVKNPKGNVVKVNFGQGGDAKGGTMRIRKSNPKARASFRARHNCDSPGPRHKARYWSCRKW